MKTVYAYLLLFFSLVFANNSAAQYINYEDDSGWNFGLNIGGSWQQDKALGFGKFANADVYPMAGLGGGFTLGKALFEREGRMLSFDLRFRYLRAVNYGQDHTPNYNLAADSIYNNSGLSYTFNNYKMDLHQYDLEGVLTLNRLRERTGIILYGFGGIGITDYRVKRNVFDANGQHYDFSGIDTSGSRPSILSGLNNVMDNTYESDINIEGAQGTQVKFMPSLGLGFGYQFTPRFSAGIEHKITYALNDNIDGILNGQNDRYHYTALILRWNLMRGKPSSHSSTHTTKPVTHTPPPHNPVVTNPVVTTPPPPPPAAPVVNITNPAQNGMAVHSSMFTVNAFVYNVAGKQNVTFKVNGVIYNGFNFNANTGQLSSTITLQPGSNVIEVIGSNPVGVASDSRIIIYEMVNMNPPPVVTITNPSYSPHTTGTNTFNVTATVLNVAAKSNIQFRVNGVATNNFTYNTNTKIVSGLINLNEGLNTIEIRGTNPVGTDVKNTQIVYQKPASLLPPPVVTINVPGQEPFNTVQSVVAVTANVKNVSSSSGIGVRVNGAAQTGFLFNPLSGAVTFNAYLVEGTNIVEVTGVNTAGAASATRSIIYKKPEILPPPTVTITQPGFSPFVTNVSNATVKATILNIQSAANVSFRINGQSSSNFSYNAISKEFTANVNLNQGNNTFEISGTNNVGTDSKVTTIIYEKPVVIQPPVVNITTPQSSPFVTQHAVEPVVAQVLNVNSAADIALTLNGVATNSFSYNITSKQLNYTANLIDGANVIQITATNQAGIASKSQTIIYNKPVVPCNVPVITITQPTSSPVLTNNNKGSILAKITGAQSVTFKINGVSSPGFNYNAANGEFESFLNLNLGATVYEISATNECGSVSQSIVYVYEILVPPCQQPVVNISSPITSGGVVAAANFSFAANALNISNVANITLNHNGSSIPFSFDATTGNISANLVLLEGNNTIEVIATNECGTATKSTSITYNKPVVIAPPPVVTYVTPSNYPHTTTHQNVTLTFKVLNITTQSQVGITKDGAPITNFTYSAASKNVTLTTTLTPGAHLFVITATNPSGSDSKNAEVIVQEPCTAPTVVINQPSTSPYTTQTPTYTVLTTAQNVSQANQINVNVNGVVFPGFNFNPNNGQVSIPVSLINGLNVITVVATNNCGVAQKTAQIDFTGCDNPVVIFEGVPDRHESLNANQFVVLGTALNATQITSVKVDGVSTNNYVFNPVDKSFIITVATKPNGNTTPYLIEVTAQNACGSSTTTYNATYVFTAEETVIGNPQQPTPPAVTITNPPNSPHTSTTQLFNFTATVNHVPSSQYITMKVNGVNYTNFLYEISTKQLTATLNLSNGSNTVEVKATTPVGSDQQSVVISYNPPAPPQIVPGPSVTINTPSVNPHEAADPNQAISAQVLHVASASEIAMSVNGVAFTGFNYNMATKALTANLTLGNGLTTVQITASNANGNDQKSVQINYNPQPANPVDNQGGCLPIVSANFAGNHMSVNVNSDKDLSNVVLKYYDGVEQKFDNLTGLTGTFSGNGNNQGKCIVGVWIKSGCNQSNDGPGYGEWIPNNAYNNECTAVPCVAPTINFTSPLATTSTPYSISATVTNVAQNEIQLMVNGLTTTFSYSANNQTLTAQSALNVGSNTISITANGCETVSDNFTVVYTLPCTPITFSLTNPTQQAETVTSGTYNISLSAQHVVTGNISVKNNGTSVPFTFNNNMLTANNVALTGGTNTIVVTLTNACSSETITYNVTYDDTPAPCGPRFNPGNADWQFCLVTPSGTYNRNDLHGNNGFTYSGPASSVFFSAIAGGGSAIVNGSPVTIQSGRYYLFTGNITVNVSTSHPGSMGHWMICIEADAAPQSGVGNNRPTSPCEGNGGGNANTPPPAPSVSITTPNTNPFVATQASQNVTAQVENVASSAEIAMTINGTAYTNFSYNTNNKTLTATLNLNTGLSLVEITATNANGTDQKSVQISYSPTGNTGGVGIGGQGGGNQGGGGCMPQVGAVFHPTALSVVANSNKDLSNVVLKYHDGVEQKFDNLSGLTGTFAGTGGNQGKCVIGVWIKSGCNQSNDGPGYGEWVPNTAYDNNCGGKQMQQNNQQGGGIIINPNQGGGNKGGGNGGNDRGPSNPGGGIQIQPNKTTQPTNPQPERNTGGGIKIQPNTGGQTTPPKQNSGGVNVKPNTGGQTNTTPPKQNSGGVNVKPSAGSGQTSPPKNTRPVPTTPPAEKETPKEEPKEPEQKETPQRNPQVAPRGPR